MKAMVNSAGVHWANRRHAAGNLPAAGAVGQPRVWNGIEAAANDAETVRRIREYLARTVRAAVACLALAGVAGCGAKERLWTEGQVREVISERRAADWYPVARGTNYAVHTWDGKVLAPPDSDSDL